ncbi:nucleoporin subcomplex protein binding to Pom34-domain-containing protein [Aspergillus egyptiacus]|nr:nucleoporin subcomplex protein binding to Pom34-domain-containing protein [Aspergillus egyptiacus]
MAPVPEAYFPSLDKCFSGDVQLLSWKRAFLYTCDPESYSADAGVLQSFLSHPESIQLLSNRDTVFPSPSAKTKSDFETKSAAIHAETTAQASYDLKEIKADALWLSEKAGIDEVNALRIAVLEWQNRPATRLLDRFADEEASSLKGASGIDTFRVSLAGPSFAEIFNTRPDEGNNAAEFLSERNRRLRLRELYLSERSHIVKTGRKLLALFLYSDQDSALRQQSNNHNGLCKLGASLFGDKINGKDSYTFVQGCIKALRTRLSTLEGDGGWLGAAESDEATENLWRTLLVEELLHISETLFLQLQASTEVPPADLLLSWLRLMVDYAFLESLQAPCDNPIEILLPLQGFASLVTLTFLKLPISLPAIISKSQRNYASTKLPFFLSKDDIGQINEIFTTAGIESKTGSPAAFAWGLILYTMGELASNEKERRELEQFHSAVDSFQSNKPRSNSGLAEISLYEELLDLARTPLYNTDDSIALLTSDAAKEIVFDTVVSLAEKIGPTSAVDDMLTNCRVRASLLDLIRSVVLYMDYSPEIVESVLAILSGPRPDSSWPPTLMPVLSSDPRTIFMKDDLLMNNIFRVARSRFPYETVPFLKLCRALLSSELVNEEGLPMIVNELENMESFTQMLPDDFQGYETIREDEDANFVSLIQPLPMIESAPRRQIQSHSQVTSNALIVTGASQIPSATVGQVVSEARPAVVMWQHQYSCLSYLGSWLEEWNENGGFSEEFGDECVAETIWLFTELIFAATKNQPQNNDDSAAKRILEMASDGLSRQNDIVSLIFDIFERNLQEVNTKTASEGKVDSTIACLHFIRTLVAVLPSRVWPLLSRSSLLGSDGKGGMMVAIVSSTEVTSGEYPFLTASVRLFEAIVDDAVSRAVLRRCPNGKAGVVSDWTSGVPSHIMRGILLNLVRTMVEVYNSSSNWRFNAPERRFEISTVIAKTLERILYYAFGTNNAVAGKLDSKVTGVFSSSATYILDVLRPQSAADLPFNPILRLIVDGLQTPPTLYLRFLYLVEKQVISTLELSTRLLQAAQLTEQPQSLLEDQLFKTTPVLVKLYALHDAYQLPILSLMDTLVTGAAFDSANEPPSLVGHLGAESSCLFLDVLSRFDKPLSDPTVELAVWRLLSTLVSKRQQWLAVYILTGSSPRQTLNKTSTQDKLAMRGTPFLQMALDKLSNIEQTPTQVSLSLLDFVSNAQEHWPWATPQLKKHSSFFSALVNYVSKLNLPSLSTIDRIFATRIAAVVADLCAVYLHSAKESQDRNFYKTLFPLVSWYAKDAVDVSGYNASLHANLKRNFETRYSGCKLDDFKRTSLQPRTLGQDYCYDIRLGQKLLSYDFAWAGSKNQGFAEEFERANLNLSLVEAQVSLLHSWKFLAVEHSSDFMAESEVQKSMTAVVKSCLEANVNGVPQEAIFERIQQTRVDFAQNLLQGLVKRKAQGAEVFGLLGVVWKSLQSRRATYEDALINDDSEYYRSLLNVLFLALQFHIDSPSRSSPETLSKKAELSSDLGIVVEIVKIVVAQGFRSLTSYLHDQPEKCTPRDFATITAILQSSLQVKNIDRLYEHIVYHIADNDTVRHATSLFSWADQLAIAGDPVYGELSVSFLAKLSTIPMLAEHLAVEATLAQLSGCRLTNVLRQPKGFGPFDPVPRLYAIWTGGILPLCLNLLYHVIRTAPEVAAFLNQFEGQLTRAAESFTSARIAVSSSTSTTRRISLTMASEAYSLALISFILGRLRKAGNSMGVDTQAIQNLKWDAAQVKEDIEELVERRANLRARIVATTENEIDMARQKPLNAASGAESRLEEKVVNELNATLACLSADE